MKLLILPTSIMKKINKKQEIKMNKAQIKINFHLKILKIMLKACLNAIFVLIKLASLLLLLVGIYTVGNAYMNGFNNQ